MSARRHISSRRAWLAGAAIVAIAGCQQAAKPDEAAAARQEMREAWTSSTPAGVSHPQAITLAQGPSPLIYQSPQSGVAHISDSTTGEELASATVHRGTLMRVDEDQGVYIDERRFRPGPMPQGHNYSIRIDVEQADAWRVGVEAPKPASRAPTSAPAGAGQ